MVESLLLTALMSIVCSIEFNKNDPALTLQSIMVSVSASIAISLRRAFPYFFIPDSPFHTAVIVINNQPTPLINHRSPYEIKSYMVLHQLIHLSGPLDVYATSTSRSPFVT